MRELTHMIFGIGNVLILVVFIIGFSILPVALFRNERAIDAGISVGGAVGLIMAIGLILAINKLRDRWISIESNKQ